MSEGDPNETMPVIYVQKFEGIEHRLTDIEADTKHIRSQLDDLKDSTSKWENRLWGIAKGAVLLCVGWCLAKLGDMK